MTSVPELLPPPLRSVVSHFFNELLVAAQVTEMGVKSIKRIGPYFFSAGLLQEKTWMTEAARTFRMVSVSGAVPCTRRMEE